MGIIKKNVLHNFKNIQYCTFVKILADVLMKGSNSRWGLYMKSCLL